MDGLFGAGGFPDVRIHIYCRSFAPAIGGMEKLLATLAEEFVRAGHDVHVVTETPGVVDASYPIHRSPGFRHYRRLARASDVILTAPLSLRRLAPQLLARRPIIVAHPDQLGGHAVQYLTKFLKKLASYCVTNVVPSKFMARYFPKPVVILNPYDRHAFTWPESRHRRDILFVGRLVERKGAHLLLEAFARIAAAWPDTCLSIVGDGPEDNVLRQQAGRLGIGARVRFIGPLRGEALSQAFRDHAIMVVPTISAEPFGIVALEGLASGCRMIVARSGGLPEAVGPHALQFDRGDVAGLAGCLATALSETEPPDQEAVERHLAQFDPVVIARQYLEVLEARAG